MQKLLLAAVVALSLLVGGPAVSHAQESDTADKKAASPKDEAPVFSYVIVSFATLIILLIVCSPSRRPVPAEE